MRWSGAWGCDPNGGGSNNRLRFGGLFLADLCSFSGLGRFNSLSGSYFLLSLRHYLVLARLLLDYLMLSSFTLFTAVLRALADAVLHRGLEAVQVGNQCGGRVTLRLTHGQHEGKDVQTQRKNQKNPAEPQEPGAGGSDQERAAKNHAEGGQVRRRKSLEIHVYFQCVREFERANVRFSF